MAAAVHRRNRAQMRPSGEIARMAHPTQPMATDRVRGRSRTRISPHPSYSGYIGGSTEFYGLQEAKIGHFGGFRRSGNRFEMRWICGMGCIRSIYDLRRPPGYPLSLQKSVITDFCRQKVGRSRFRVRHDAGVFRPNRRHQRNANGEKTLKPGSFGVWGGRTKKVEATSLNQRPAKCAIAAVST